MINTITCKEVMGHICESLGEDLNSPKCRAIKEHLEGCTNCTNYFKSIGKTIEFYKNYNYDLNPETHSRLMNFLDLDDKSI